MEQEILLTLGREIKVSGCPGLTHSRVYEGMEGGGEGGMGAVVSTGTH